jgi:hypothetical protein
VETLLLVTRQRENTSQIVVVLRVLLFRIIGANVSPTVIGLADNVKQEGIYIVVKRLVVQKELGQEGEILAVDLILKRR